MLRNPTADLIVVLVIVLLFLGPKRLPGLGKSLGQGMREFKDSISGDSGDAKDEGEDKPAIPPATTGSDATPGAGSPPAAAPARESAEVSSERNP